MRRTFATKSVIQFGNSQFNVFELVFLLNEIKSMYYCHYVNINEERNKKERITPALKIEENKDKQTKKKPKGREKYQEAQEVKKEVIKEKD